MAPRSIVRGLNDDIYFVEKTKNGSTVQILRPDDDKPGMVKKDEVFKTNDSQIISLEIDTEYKNKSSSNDRQSIYVMDDKAKVYHIVSEPATGFYADKTIEVKSLKKTKTIS